MTFAGTTTLPTDEATVFQWVTPAVAPSGFGLLNVATPVADNDKRFPFNGVSLQSPNCSTSFGSWPVAPCVDPTDPDAIKAGDRQPYGPVFEPTGTWAYEECDPQETDAQNTARALVTLRLRQPIIVEQEFAARLIADSAAGDVESTSFLAAIGNLEERIGETGMNGFIHASIRFAALAADAGILVKSGSLWKTQLGNTWVFGGGYADVLADTLVATGPVYFWRGNEKTFTTLDERINRRAAVAEQQIVVAYECFAESATIVPPETP